MRLFGKKRNSGEEEFEEEEDGRSVKRKSSKPLEKKKKKTEKKKEEKKKWGKGERLFVFGVLVSTTLGSGVLALSARSWKLPGYPRLDLTNFDFEKTYVLEAERQEGAVYEEIEEQFRDETRDLTGVYGFYVARVREGVSYGYLADESFAAASLIKLPVLVMVLNEVDEGRMALRSTYRLREEDIVGGAGSMQYDEPGTVYSYEEMILKMGKESDNTAFSVFVDALGESEVEEFIYDVGMRDTSLEENTTTPSDVGRLFRKVMRGNILSSESRELFLEALTDTNYEEHLVAGVAEGVVVAHKYGLEANVVNDAGVIFVDDPYIVVLMSKGVIQKEADGVFPRLSQIIYEFEGE